MLSRIFIVAQITYEIELIYLRNVVKFLINLTYCRQVN